MSTVGSFYLANGVKSDFKMTETNPSRNWKWAGPFLWLMVLPLEHPVPHDRVPDGIVFEERADGLSVLDSHGRREGANGVAGKKG